MSTTSPTAIDMAAYELTQAKAAEAAATKHRLACEDKLISLVGAKEEGTTSLKTSFYKVSTVGSLIRSLVPNWREALDDDAIDAASFAAAIKTKAELSVSGLKSVATANPKAYQAILKAIVTKPAKTSVKVELLEQHEEAA